MAGLAAGAALIAGACAGGSGGGARVDTAAGAIASGPTAAFTVPGNAGNATFVSHDQLVGADGTTVRLLSAVSVWDNVTPLVLRSADRSRVIYNSFSWVPGYDANSTKSPLAQGFKIGDPLGTPSIHLVDRSGVDSVLETGAHSIAWDGSGPLAYVKSADPSYRAQQRWVGDVYVRPTPTAAPVKWTTASGPYTVLAWAAGRLLFTKQLPDTEATSLYIADGPRQVRQLGDAEETLVGISPDGTMALAYAATDINAGRFEILNLATGAAVGAVNLAGSKIANPGALGAWDGNTLLVTAADGPRTAFVVFTWSAAGPSLTVTKVIDVDPAVAPFIEHGYMTGNHTHAMGISVDRVTPGTPPPKPPATAPVFSPTYTLVDCVIATGVCTSSSLNLPGRGNQLMPLRNLSRPRVATTTVEEES